MPLVTLRVRAGTSSDIDLIVEVKDNTFEYLLTSPASSMRVSTYLDRDWPQVEAEYAELYINDETPFESHITRVTPGSRTRKDIHLPGPMKEGEQLTLEIKRDPKSS